MPREGSPLSVVLWAFSFKMWSSQHKNLVLHAEMCLIILAYNFFFSVAFGLAIKDCFTKLLVLSKFIYWVHFLQRPCCYFFVGKEQAMKNAFCFLDVVLAVKNTWLIRVTLSQDKWSLLAYASALVCVHGLASRNTAGRRLRRTGGAHAELISLVLRLLLWCLSPRSFAPSSPFFIS